jgi:hypothetical protein
MSDTRDHRPQPDRPRRPVEREYLAVLADVVPLEVWREVVQRTVDDAKAGDARAREWLTRHLLGKADEACTLTALASLEAAGIDPADEIAQAASRERDLHSLRGMLGGAGTS